MQFLKGFYQVGGSLNGVTRCGDYDTGTEYADGNVYALDTGDGLALFDAGNGETLDQIFDNLRYWGLDPRDIRACLVTHPHLDHAGGCARLKALGVTLYAHENTADAMAAGDERCCGYLYHKKFTPCRVDVRLRDGDVVRLGSCAVTARHFPGHTMGCTAYFLEIEGRSVVVSGDIIGTLLAGYFGWDGSFDFDKKIYTDSLVRFARYAPDVMLPGHGLIYFGNPQSRVEAALNQALIQWR